MKAHYLLAALSAALASALPAAARADGPLSVTVGPSFVTQGAARNLGGTTQTNLGAALDFGPRIIVPVRASLVVDYAGGSGPNGSLSSFGGGLGARTTTPVYIGASLLVYNATAQPSGGASVSKAGLGSNIFLGEKLIDVPGGIGLSLQATYRQVPQINGLNPSGYAVGLRVQL